MNVTAAAVNQVWAHRRETRRVRIAAINATHAFVVPVLPPGSMAGAGRHRTIRLDRLPTTYRLETS